MLTTLKISGMSCGHCVMGVKNALKSVPGIKSFNVVIGEATVESDSAIDPKVLKDAIEEEGYEVVAVS